MDPLDPIKAASHPNPYPYYATLRRREPQLEHDPALKLWVASKAGAVLEILHNPALVVRPPEEPVPKAIDHSAAGTIFGQLVRMNEGKYHPIAKTALEVALQSADRTTVSGIAQRRAREAAAMHGLEAARLTEWAFDVPIRCIGELVGTPDWLDLTDRVREFVACLSAQSSPAQLATASEAAEVLQTRLQPIATAIPAYPIVREARSHGLAAQPTLPNPLVSNLVGLFSQTFEATAGLIGNCIVALITHPDIHTELRGRPTRVNAFVREVSRYDPSVQNTRRFAASAVRIGSALVQPGEAILVLLGAASRDDALYVEAERFRLDRSERAIIGFSSGRHQCPGEHIAQAIAAGAITYLLDSGMTLSQDHIAWTYRPSPNARIPQFATR